MLSTPRKALSWSFVRNVSSLGITAALGFLLAAILGPESFGIVAIAGIFVFFLQILGGNFFLPVIIQREVLTKGHQDTIFWVNVIWCLVMAIAAYLSSGIWATINNTPEVAAVIVALSPLILVRGFALMPTCLLMRTLNFKHLTYAVVISSAFGGIGGVYMGLNGYGVWSLVAQQWIDTVMMAGLVWYYCPYSLGFNVSWKYLRDVLPFARGALLSDLGGFAQGRAEAVLIGIFFGPVLIALYRICEKVVQLVVSPFSGAISSFILPYASQHQNDTKKLTQIADRCIRLNTGLSFPILGVLAGMSSIVLEVLGDEWRVAWLGLSLLCIIGAVQSYSLLTPHLLLAIGKPGVAAALMWGNACTSVAALAAVAFFVQGDTPEYQLAALVGARVLVSLVVNVPANFFLINWAVNISPAYLLRILFAPILSFVAGMGSGYFLLNSLIPETWELYARFIVSAMGAGGIAIAVLFLLDNYVFRVFIDFLKAMSNRFFAKRA